MKTSSKKQLKTGARPFLKWVGGKSQLLSQLQRHYPKKYNRYFEPFVGGGAVYFDIQPKMAFINDINRTLITAYGHIQGKPNELIKLLRKLHTQYHELADDKRSDLYYEIRTKFNAIKDTSLEKSAYLIFLNKTGYNGMYRESSNGGYNVPFGKYKNPTILDEENIRAVSEALKEVVLTSFSFEEAVANTKKGDFVYFDPPYHPLNGTAKFTSYTEKKFLEDEQRKLRDVFVELDKRGCFVMMSNSHTDFIGKLYKGYKRHTVLANRAINCKADGRGKIKEYVITNY